MGKVRRGNFIFIWWKGDHGHHVHVFRGKREVVKWDLDDDSAIEGSASKRLRKILGTLKKEGAFSYENPTS